jgi:hypothetical protein
MPSKRKDVSASRTQSNQNIEFSMEDLQLELRRLHEEGHPTRQEGEFTIEEYYNANKDKFKSIQQAENELDEMNRRGRIDKHPKRYINGRLRIVFIESSTSKNEES